MAKGLSRSRARERAKALLTEFLPGHRGHLPAAALTYGEERKVGIARALALEPRYLLLDEPAAGMAAAEVEDLRLAIVRIRAAYGCGILVVEHNMALIFALCGPNPCAGQREDAGYRLAGRNQRQCDCARGLSRRVRERIRMSLGSEAVLRVEDLTIAYDSVIAVKQATFEVGAGEIVAIIGPNGAGKSSLLAAITAIAPRARGRIEICGRSIDDVPRSEIVRLGAALVPEGRQIFTSLSVIENLKLGATIRRDKEIAADLEAVFAEFPVLAERRRQMAGLLSGGEQQMLAIARALMSRPRLLMLDEPSLGLAPMALARVYDKLTAIRSRGVAILVAEQNAARAFAVADRVLIIGHGRFSLSGRPRRSRRIAISTARILGWR